MTDKIFTEAYITAALWTEEDNLKDDGVEAWVGHVAPYDLGRMQRDCDIFWTLCHDMIVQNAERAGHDFWLTRNGHGTGFWDDESYFGEENAQKLAECARAFGEANLYVGDDKLIHYIS